MLKLSVDILVAAITRSWPSEFSLRFLTAATKSWLSVKVDDASWMVCCKAPSARANLFVKALNTSDCVALPASKLCHSDDSRMRLNTFVGIGASGTAEKLQKTPPMSSINAVGLPFTLPC